MKINKKISSFGNPPQEFIIYEGCHYLYDGQPCKLIEFMEDTLTDKDKVIIEFDGLNRISGNLYSLAPYPITDKLLNSISGYNPHKNSDNIIEWHVEDEIPYSVVKVDNKYHYNNPIMIHQNNAPINVSFWGDLEAIQIGFLKDPLADKIYSRIKNIKFPTVDNQDTTI